MDRELTPLLNVADLLAGFAFSTEFYTSDTVGPRLMLGANVAPGSPNWEKKVHWPTRLLDGLEKYRLIEGDVVLAMDRPWIPAGLKMFRLPRADAGCLLVQRVARLRGGARLDTGYLYYSLRAQAFTNYILGVQTGSTVPHISSGQILGYEIHLPPLPEQRRIAAVLGALDDKIDLNRRMNRTLEGMAQAIFKSWFIDFDGHTDFVDSELGPIPSGWVVQPLDQIARFLNGLALQNYPPTGSRALPVIKIRELNQGVGADSDLATADVPPEYIVRDGDLLFSWSGSLVVRLWTGGLGALNQHLFKVTSDRYPQWFYYRWLLHHLAEFRNIAADKATTMGHIQRKHLSAALTLVPTEQVLAAMTATMRPLLARQITADLESRTLAALRDTLLPKLISGEIRVPEALEVIQEGS